jgi:type I restriction modification DNA specificity domain protein
MTKQPSYRFVGYIEPWEEKKLGEVSEKVREKNSDNLYSSVLTNSAEFGIIPQRDFFDKDIANEKNLNGYYIVRQNDFVYNPRISNYAPVGPIKPNKLNEIGVMSPLYYVFRTHDIENSYLATYFDTTYWHKFMKTNGDSGARADRFAIKDSVFVEMPIPFPSLPEQTAIGYFFQDIDQLISLQQRKLEVLKEQKKTYLKLLFPAKGQTKPALRFVEFEDEWTSVLLGDISELYQPKTISSEDLLTEGFPVFGANGYIGYYKDYNHKENQVTISARGEGTGTPSFVEGPVWITGNSMVVNVEKQDNISKPFLYAFCLSFDFKPFVTGGAQPQLTREVLKKVNIMLPSLPEQQAIGSFFQDLDKAIAKQEEKVKNLKESKQTLLRKMFI